MKNLVWTISFAFLFSLFGTEVFASEKSRLGELDYVPNEIVVKLKRSQDLRLVAKKYGLNPQPLDRFGNRPIYRLEILNGTPPPQLAEEMLNDPKGRVIYAEPNFLLGFPEQNRESWSIGGTSTQYATQWFRDVIRLPQAHTVTQGAGTKIAVLDTGVTFNHPQLAGRFVQGYDFVDDDNDPSEVGSQPQNQGFGHGTHVAGLIALVAPQAQIMPVRVLNPNGEGNIWVLAEAIDYAANPDGDPTTPDGADVINLSLATLRNTSIIEEIIDEITCDDDDFGNDDDDFGSNACNIVKDVVVVAGAGNNSNDIPVYPAGEGVPGLIAVAATTPTDTLAAFSNYGPWVTVASPGQNILSTVPPNLFGTWSGTSMSTPLVAGQAALIRSQNPEMTAAEISDRIVSTSVTINALVPRRIDIASSLLIP